MGEVVGAVGVPHDPAFPEMAMREGASCRAAIGFGRARDHLERLRPDVLVVFTTDHLNTFFFENWPLLAVGVAEGFAGPNDAVPAMRTRIVPSHARFARHLHRELVEREFDVALAQEFEADHSAMVPLHFLSPPSLPAPPPVVPVFVSGHRPPLPAARRCLRLGEAVRASVEAWPGPLRVAAVGSGSFSFDVHGHRSPTGSMTGVPDPAWAGRVAELLARDALPELVREATPERLESAGNVAGELLNWLAAIGTTGRAPIEWIVPAPAFGHAYAGWGSRS